MSSFPDPVSWYSDHAGAIGPVYDAIDAAKLHGWLDELVPTAAGPVLDVGTGTGRDGIWVASLGHDVVAVEPSPVMRAEGQRCHPAAGLRWIDDRLPALHAATLSV